MTSSKIFKYSYPYVRNRAKTNVLYMDIKSAARKFQVQIITQSR